MTALAPQIWFVTGCSAGLGRALVTELLARGETVAATARDPCALADLRSPTGQPPWTARLDVTDPDRIRQVVDEAVAVLGRIDVVVSNAGYGLFGAAEEATDEQVERLVRTNLTGPMHVARAVLRHMRRQGYGRILQISSVSGQCTQPGTAVYNATKWGVEGFFESLAAEVARFGIRVTIVEPGTVRTEFAGRSRQQTAALPDYAGTPAATVRRLVESGRVPYRGDLARMVDAIIAAATAPEPPLRLALGSDTYQLIHRSLSTRLAALEGQKDLALSTDLKELGTR